MESRGDSKRVAALCGILAAFVYCSQPAKADYMYGTPSQIANLGPRNTAGACLSADGLEFYFVRDAEDGCQDLWICRRSTVRDTWGQPVKIDAPVNSPGPVGSPCISSDGLELYFSDGWPPGVHCAANPSGYGGGDLWVSRRATKDDPWRNPENLGPMVNTANWEDHCSLSADGLSLYFVSGPPFLSYSAASDIYVTTRQTKQDPWRPRVAVSGPVNTWDWETTPFISPDGLSLFFARGSVTTDIYVSRRATTGAAWGNPTRLGAPVNSVRSEWHAFFSLADPTLYYERSNGYYGPYELWQAAMVPTVDFNGDGKVDVRDIGILTDNWGKNTSLCDIGPFPWGDGVVDERDLQVLMESLMTPAPEASDVFCDGVLAWVSPSFAQTCDVYFGTSQEAVRTGSRTNPQGVLVSQGQTTTTYDPPGSLEFSKTYYWRVDFVVSSPGPAIYPGPVVRFTTEAYARPLKSISATASSFQRGTEPTKTVDGSGLDKNDGHSTTGPGMWLSQGTPPHWIQYAFDQVYTLHELWVWNQNQAMEPFIGFGAKTVKIEYSTDGTKWTPLANVPEFARAPGNADYVHNTTVSFGGVSAQYVKLIIEKGWGATASVGLSEVRFFYIPDRSTPKP